MSGFAALHLGAFGIGAGLGVCRPVNTPSVRILLFVIGSVGLCVSLVILRIFLDPVGGSNAGGATDLMFLYGILLFVPMLIVLPLIAAGGWMVGQLLGGLVRGRWGA